MSTSYVRQPIVKVLQTSASANVSKTVAIGSYSVALVLIGNANRTAAQSAIYAVFNNADPMTVVSSAYVSLTSDGNGNITVTAQTNTSVTVLVIK